MSSLECTVIAVPTVDPTPVIVFRIVQQGPGKSCESIARLDQHQESVAIDIVLCVCEGSAIIALEFGCNDQFGTSARSSSRFILNPRLVPRSALIARLRPAMLGCFVPIDPTMLLASYERGEAREPPRVFRRLF